MRWTATNITPADDRDAKNSQLTWYARHARSGAMNSPTMKTSVPSTDSTSASVPRAFGSGLLYVATSSSREGTCTGCKLIGHLRDSASWSAEAEERQVAWCQLSLRAPQCC